MGKIKIFPIPFVWFICSPLHQHNIVSKPLHHPSIHISVGVMGTGKEAFPPFPPKKNIYIFFFFESLAPSLPPWVITRKTDTQLHVYKVVKADEFLRILTFFSKTDWFFDNTLEINVLFALVLHYFFHFYFRESYKHSKFTGEVYP